MPRELLKRGIDFALSAVLLVVFSPVLFGASLLILFCSGRPVIFAQERVGMGCRKFVLFKFRTMVLGAENFEENSPEKNKLITWEGHILRKLYVDEIPQLWNIFLGQMSFVGPRPIPEWELKVHLKKDKRYAEIFHNKPGITGLASIVYYLNAKQKARIFREIDIKKLETKDIQKLRNEIEPYYLEKKSAWFDLLIMEWTIVLVAGKVFRILKRWAKRKIKHLAKKFISR